MHRLFVFFLLLSQFASAQNNEGFDPLSWPGNVKPDNLIRQYSGCDFSPLWLVTPNQHVLGIIGKENQRIRVKLLTVTRDEKDPLLYNVTGKSSVMGNICDFSGTIRIKEIKEIAGPDSETGNINGKGSVKSSGILYGVYEFSEVPTQFHVGIFSGKLASIWYLDTSGTVRYNKLAQDGYYNNFFTGTWKSYKGNDERICVWADYNIPVENSDLNKNSSGFMPAAKYQKRGWQNYVKAYRDKDKDALQEEEREWWK